MSDSAQEPSTSHVYHCKASNNSPFVYTTVEGIMDPIKTLIDSGSSRNFISITFARKHALPLIELQHQRTVIGIDGNETQDKIRFRTSLTLEVEGRTFKQRFYAMPLGDTALILGTPWLTEADPDISWRDFKIQYRDEGTEDNNEVTGKTSSEPPIPEEFKDFSLFLMRNYSRDYQHTGNTIALSTSNQNQNYPDWQRLTPCLQLCQRP